MNLLNLATFIALLVVAFQYMLNNFLGDLIEKRAYKRTNDPRKAKETRDEFTRIGSWVILMFYIVAIILGVINFLTEM